MTSIGLSLLPVFTASFLASLILTPLARIVALRLGAVAQPKHDRWHRGTIPVLGGAAVWASVVVATVFATAIGRDTLALVVCGWSMCAVGLVDDFLHLKPSTKLTAQIASACIAVLLGVTLNWFSSPLANAFLTIGWIVGVTNAINLLDNMDGLCAGVVTIAALSMVLSGPGGGPSVVHAVAIAGACAGFLVYNFNPASIFLGDSGSLFLGSSIAILAIMGTHGGPAGVVSALLVPALFLMIPIFDTLFVTISRKLSARSATVGGRDHTSHRLVAMGFSERHVVLMFYALAAVGGAIAVSLQYAQLTEAPLVLGVLLLGLLLLGLQLARVKVYGGQDYTVLKDRAYTPLLVEITYKRRMFEVLLDLALVTFSYYAAYVIRFDREFDLYYPLLVRSLPIVIATQLVSFFIVGVYRPMWRYFSASDLATYVRGLLLGTVGSVLILLYLYRFEGYSRSVFIIYAMSLGVLMVGSRASFRILADVASRHSTSPDVAVIFGAGDGGALIVRELRNNNRYPFRAVAFVDDDPTKLNRRVLGVPIAGTLAELSAVLDRYRPGVLIISTDKVPAAKLAQLQAVCAARGVRALKMDFKLREIDGEMAAVDPAAGG